MFFKLALCFLAIGSAVEGQITPTESFTHSATLRSGNIKLYWNFNETDITFEVHGNTTGWVGIGFSPNGAMTGADIFVGWVKNGEAKVTDRHGTGNTFPPLDPSQDINLLEGAECDGWTMFKFSRQLAACEADYDREISVSTQRLIFAWGDEDPTGDDIAPGNYHGAVNRGVESMYFLQSPSTPTELPVGPTYQTFDILADNFEIPAEETYYNCKLYKLPTFTKKHHIVKLEPIIQEGNERNVHHMLVYKCADALNETEVGVDARCYVPNMARDTCTGIVVSWAIGGGVQIFPEVAGLSIGAEGDPIFIQVEIHYDNPTLQSGITDSSGIRFTYTDTLRENDIGTVQVGASTLGTEHLIPPGAESFLSVSHCPSRCIEDRLQDAGVESVSIFSVMLHSHLAGRSLRLRHIRDGVELPYIGDDENYDFNYQETRYLESHVTWTKNDSLQMECVYNTEGRTVMTEGGLGTQQEMCMAFVHYYPKIDLSFCISSVSSQVTWPYLGIDLTKVEQIPGTDPYLPASYNLTGPPEVAGMTVLEYMNEYDWPTEERIDAFADYYNSAQHYELCMPQNRSLLTFGVLNVIEIATPYVAPQNNCSEPSFPLTQETTLNECRAPPTNAPVETTTSGAVIASVSTVTSTLLCVSAIFIVS